MFLTSSGEMSEKLRRCRKELAAAIDRAFEEIVAPSFISPQDYSIHLVPEYQTSSTASPKINHVVFGTNSTLVSSYVHQSFPICYSPENVYPALLPNRFSACPKRRPLTSKENVMMNSAIPDEQPVRTCGDSENWRTNLRKDADRYLKPEVYGPQGSYGQELTKDLLDIIEHTNIQTIEELAGKLEFENVLNKVCTSPLKEEVLSLFVNDNHSNITDVEAKNQTIKAADDTILETVLDLEEEYDLLPSVRQLIDS